MKTIKSNFGGFFLKGSRENFKYNKSLILETDNKLIELWSNDVIQQNIDYIHNNLVEEGIVFRAEDYKYSSTSVYAEQKGICIFSVF